MRKHLFLLSSTVIAGSLLCTNLCAGGEGKSSTPRFPSFPPPAYDQAPAGEESYPPFAPPSYAETIENDRKAAALKAQEEYGTEEQAGSFAALLREQKKHLRKTETREARTYTPATVAPPPPPSPASGELHVHTWKEKKKAAAASAAALKAQEEADALMARQLQETEDAAARAAASHVPAAIAEPEPAVAAPHQQIFDSLHRRLTRHIAKPPAEQARSLARGFHEVGDYIEQVHGGGAVPAAVPTAAPAHVAAPKEAVKLPAGVAIGTIVNEKPRRKLADKYSGGECRRSEEEEDNPGQKHKYARKIPAFRCSFNWIHVQPRKQLTATGWKDIAPIETLMEGNNAGLHTHFLDKRTPDRWRFPDPSAPGGLLIKKGPFPEEFD